MTDAPTITALAPWFGSKRTLAPTIAEELGPHRSFWDPFCGSMAVLGAKPVSALETVNDLHRDLYNLARVVADPKMGPALYRQARRLFVHESLHAEARARVVEVDAPKEPDIARALDFLVVSWMGRNGECGLAPIERASRLCVRWTACGGNPATRWSSVVGSLVWWRRRLGRVTILNRDGFEVLGRIQDSEDAAIYLDPPYFQKSDHYLHDFEPTDHLRLATEARRFRKARVVISYYDHPKLAELYPGWTKRHCYVSKALAHQGRRGANNTRAPEVLLLNGPSFAAHGQGMLF